MNNRQDIRNHLRLADETVESYREEGAGTAFKERVVLSFAMLALRTLTAALLEIAQSISEIAVAVRQKS